MKFNSFGRLITNSPIRAFGQRRIEGPDPRNMGIKNEYPLCLDIGCGKGVGAGRKIRAS